ncbi:hypothetical protein [Corallococcus exiguus]|uniref:hypothetical protein n=1 Tax=Corallococcus exiguus TaxID=83462 RepID=UPI001560439E|nr:hypothetical protein [Corallococcus exiguus]NRD50139.1 hypothetical protein [Corallococcus exiguus]
MSEPSGRTYNQNHAPRKYSRSHRRVSVYTSWSYPGEANRNPAEMDNRFSTMTEVRRVLWPNYESPQWADPRRFQQGIAGSLELFFWAWVRFQQVIEEVTGHKVPMFQPVDQAGFPLPLDERVLADADTLLVFGLDHDVTEQVAAPEEIEAVRAFLEREGTCLVMGPHHDVGHSPDLDTRGWLTGVQNFNFHMHLPHYAVTQEDSRSARVLAKQPIDRTRPHPFTNAGNTEFNALVWMPPGDGRAGDVLVADSTIFSTLFGADESLVRFWKNLATAH